MVDLRLLQSLGVPTKFGVQYCLALPVAFELVDDVLECEHESRGVLQCGVQYLLNIVLPKYPKP